MCNKLEVFQNDEFGEIRVTEVDGKPYFCAADIAKALGYSNPNKAVNDHCRAITKFPTPISGKIQQINFIPEGDVYRLIEFSQIATDVVKIRLLDFLNIKKNIIPLKVRNEIDFIDKLELFFARNGYRRWHSAIQSIKL